MYIGLVLVYNCLCSGLHQKSLVYGVQETDCNSSLVLSNHRIHCVCPSVENGPFCRLILMRCLRNASECVNSPNVHMHRLYILYPSLPRGYIYIPKRVTA